MSRIKTNRAGVGKCHIMAAKHPMHEWRYLDVWYDDRQTGHAVAMMYNKIWETIPTDDRERGELLGATLRSGGIPQARFAGMIGVTRRAIELNISGRLRFPTIRICEAMLVKQRIEKLYSGVSRPAGAVLRLDNERCLGYPNSLIDKAIFPRYNRNPGQLSDHDRVCLLAHLVRQSRLRPADFAPLLGITRAKLSLLVNHRTRITPELLARAVEMSKKARKALRPLRSYTEV